mgnify:CR=1 FL=1|jgi:hypothetical protein
MKKSEINISSNKSFGLVFFVFFLIITIYLFKKSGDIQEWSLIISIIFLILSLLNSKILSPLNKIWFKFGIILGNIVSPIIMGIIFFLIVTPTSIVMRILGKNLLNLKRNNEDSYWIKRSKIKSKMKDQF